jgi:hypothetical protein
VRHVRRFATVCLVLALFVTVAGCDGDGGGWRRVDTAGVEVGTIVAVDASTAFAWTNRITLAWNGTRWRTVDAPDLTQLSTAVPVPHSRGLFGIDLARLFRWDGRWHRVTAPATGGTPQLFAVAASGDRDAWVVGDRQPAGGSGAVRPYAARWDGHRLTEVAVPLPADAAVGQLAGVVALSPTDAWAVGTYAVDPTRNEYGLFVVRWDGKAWQRTGLPRTHRNTSPPRVALAVSAGAVYLSLSDLDRPLLLRRQHGGWHAVPVPAGLSLDGGPVAADGAGGLWLGGVDGPHHRPVYAHYRAGGSWSRTPVPQDPRGSTDPAWAQAGVAALAPVPGTEDLWAVAVSQTGSGEEDDAVTGHAAIQRYRPSG